jgi:fructan beta-fructosidase
MKRLLLLPVLFCCTIMHAQTPMYKELYRPQFHFSPSVNWTNDPNGLVYYKGEYHLFYQYNPFGNTWGHMTWGHAVSKDLVHWRHLPIAIPEENGVMIFSGSCVADIDNTSGFGTKKTPPMVAIYTGHTDTNQSQCLAYSLDKGRTWKKYAGNPVLDLHKKDFRDPKVFWDEQKKYWVMLVVLPDKHIVQSYSSPNLKSWAHLSDFGPAGDTSSVWECPDLSLAPMYDPYPYPRKSMVPLPWKHVLLISVQNAMQYFVGSFNGKTFTDENPATTILRPDYGPDYYAAISYNLFSGVRVPITIGWANNWNYAKEIPTAPWRSAMSLPRQLAVKKVNNTWVLLQKPVFQLQALRQTILASQENQLLNGTKSLPVHSQQMEIVLKITPGASAVTGVRIASGNGHEMEIGYDAGRKILYLDRGKTANQSFSKAFAERKHFEAPLLTDSDRLDLHIFFDHSIVEVFANNGQAVMTAQIFPDSTDNGVELFSNGANSRINSLEIWSMASAW